MADEGPSPRLLAGRYRLGPTIGTGATAKVFDAVDITDSTPVVIKLLPAAFGRSEAFVRRFQVEVQAAAELTHPNVARVRDFGIEQIEGRPYPFVVTDQFGGGSLRHLIDRRRTLSPAQALLVGLDVCKGLDHAHRRGLVHGAITPSNLLFGLDRKVRIADFGLSRLLGAVAWADRGRVDVDVARYASPEQAAGVPIVPASDVYTLCLTLIEAVTGQVPFSADTSVATLAARLDRLMPVSADLGPLAAVLERAGRPSPEDRASASEFGRALVRAAENMPRPEPIPIVGMGRFGEATGSLPRVDDATADATGAVATLAPSAPAARATSPAPQRVLVPNVPPPVDEPPGRRPIDDADLSGVVIRRPPPGPVEPVEADEPVEATVPVQRDEPAEAPVPVEPVDESSVLPAGSVDAPHAVADAEAALTDGADTDDVDQAIPADQADGAPTLALAIDPGLPPVADPTDDVPLGDAVGPWRDTTGATRRPTAKVETVEGDEDDEPDLGRRGLFAYVLVAFGLVLAAVVGIVGYRALSTPSFAVPELIGVSEAEARNQVAANGWTIEVRRQRDDTQPQDNVIRTEPPAGEKLEKGATLVIVVSDGPTLAVLPEIAGLPVDEARTLLVQTGLSVREGERVFDETIEPGRVVSWSVPAQAGIVAGGEVPRGTTVQVVVSKGPAPRPVPNLVGVTVAEATQALADRQLTLGTVVEQFDDTVPAGQIVSSDPAAGTEAARGSAVAVVVSKGPDLVTVPNLFGLTKAEMEAAIERVGLVLGAVSGPFDGVVAGTDWAPGSRVPRGTKINVTFGTA